MLVCPPGSNTWHWSRFFYQISCIMEHFVVFNYLEMFQVSSFSCVFKDCTSEYHDLTLHMWWKLAKGRSLAVCSIHCGAEPKEVFPWEIGHETLASSYTVWRSMFMGVTDVSIIMWSFIALHITWPHGPEAFYFVSLLRVNAVIKVWSYFFLHAVIDI